MQKSNITKEEKGGSPNYDIELENVSISFGGIKALDAMDLRAKRGRLIAIIGPNGAGKTTIFNIINGFYQPDTGDVYVQGKKVNGFEPHKIAGLGVARVFQNIELFRDMTVLDNLLLGRHLLLNYGVTSSVIFYGKAMNMEMENRRKVEEIIDFLEIETIRKKYVGSLSYGTRKRVELARALCMEPKVLLLDEPVAGMNVEETEDIVRFIIDTHEEMGITIFLVEHDMKVIMDIAEHVVVLNFGRKIAEGTPSEIQKNPDVIKAYLGQESRIKAN